MARQRRTSQRITMDDVARVAGVSPSTVSLYLRRPDEVSGRRGERIQTAVDRLGYVPNTMAGGLASAKSRIIGVLVPTIINSFFAATLDQLERTLRAAGYQVLIGNTEFNDEREEELLRSMLSWSPAALVVTGFQHTRKTRSILLDGDIPLVEMWDCGAEAIDMCVGFSHEDAGRAMAQHLLDQGYSDTAVISPSFKRDIRAQARYHGFRSTIEAAGGHVELGELSAQTDTVETSQVLCRLMRERPTIQAVFGANDMVSLGVMFECYRQGWAIPDRLAVAGFGNLEFGASSVPPLTTIEPPKYEIGKRVSELLIQRLRGREVADGRLDLGIKLIARDST